MGGVIIKLSFLSRFAQARLATANVQGLKNLCATQADYKLQNFNNLLMIVAPKKI